MENMLEIGIRDSIDDYVSSYLPSRQPVESLPVLGLTFCLNPNDYRCSSAYTSRRLEICNSMQTIWTPVCKLQGLNG